MTIAEATLLRDRYVEKLVGMQYDSSRPDWAIKDIIICDRASAGDVYTKIFRDNLSNEEALKFFSIKDDQYDALIIAHPYPLNDGDILVESVENYVSLNQVLKVD